MLKQNKNLKGSIVTNTKILSKYLFLVNLVLVGPDLRRLKVSRRKKQILVPYLLRLLGKVRILKQLRVFPQTGASPNYLRYVSWAQKNFKVSSFAITLKVRINNVFCTFKNLNTNKMIFMRSAGIYKLKVSKKTLKFNTLRIIKQFFNELKRFLKPIKQKQIFYLKLSAPLRIRLKIFRIFIQATKRHYMLRFINILEKKAFNGCRPVKAKRKKGKGLRIFKH